MAVVNVKSLALTNRDATPRILNPSHLLHGHLRVARGMVEVANGDSIASTFRLCEIPSNAIIESIRIYCDAITSAAADIGLYKPTDQGGAVLDVDAYATAQSIATAIVLGTEVMFEARNIDKIEKRVFEDAGLTTDPGGTMDLVATLTAAATAAGTLGVIVRYVVPS